jgi:hypothetical protein
MVKGDLVKTQKTPGYPGRFGVGKVGTVLSHGPVWNRIYMDSQEMFLIIVDGETGVEYKCNLEPINAQD